MIQRAPTLFRRTALTLAMAFALLLLVVFGALAYYVTVPLGRQATGDLAALMVLSAQTWAELPPATRTDFERELELRHGLIIQTARAPLPDHTSYLPYRALLEQALSERLGHAVAVRTTHDPEFYWTDIPVGNRTLRVGFARDRIGVQPPYALASIFAALLVFVVATALLLARRLTHPLTQLAQAAQAVGRGQAPEPLAETGPAELAALARAFNRMAQDVRELLANRTTLLAGVSHDLRTPLARLRLAVEMLPRDVDSTLLAGLERDIEAMDALLGQYLELARGMVEEIPETLDLRELVDAAVVDARRAGAEIRWTPGTAPLPYTVRAGALARILTNLLDNARRYGGARAIDVECERTEDQVVIRVLDRGPGIPAAERDAVFRPFHRLEPARSAAGGGSGLGLAIARQLADANHWRIALDARPDGGTVASVRIAGKAPA